MEWAVAENKYVGPKVILRCCNMPGLIIFMPGGITQFVVPVDMRINAEAPGTTSQIGLDLGLGRIGTAPGRIEGKGERVEMGLDITGTTWIGIVTPCSADVGCSFDYNKIIDALLFQAYGHTQAREASSQDSDVNMGFAMS